MSNTKLAPRSKTTTLRGLPVSGLIAIPGFAVEDDDEGAFPYCCGINVIGSFNSEPLNPENYEHTELFGDGYDNRKYITEYDRFKGRYVEKKNPDYDPGPWSKTSKLTKKEAMAWWDNYALDVVGTSTLMATTVPDQKFVRDNLLAAGWEEVVTFTSKGTRNTITLLRYTVEQYIYPPAPKTPKAAPGSFA